MTVEIQLSTDNPSSDWREGEPVTVGMPFPKASLADVRALSLRSEEGAEVPLQARVLDRWSDGSVRWALLDFKASRRPDTPGRLLLAPADRPAEQAEPMALRAGVRTARVETGPGAFEVCPTGEIRYRPAETNSPEWTARFDLTDAGGRKWPVSVTNVACEEQGPLRTCILMEADAGPDGEPALRLFGRFHFYAGTSAVRVQATLRNPSAAVHAGGFWDLGDPASRYLEDFSFVVTLPGGHPWAASCSLERGAPLVPCALPLTIYQDSSGGENWRSSNHVNRNGEIPLRFRGYSCAAGSQETAGSRATPIVCLRSGTRVVSVAYRQFWERFPKAIEATAATLRIGLLPGELADAHEIQGGEQVSEELLVCFDEDRVSEVPLAWVRDPLRPMASPAWYCAAEAMPHLASAADDPNVGYLELVNAAIEGPEAFAVKRERIDEYGWRHFGDLYADHETVKHAGPQPLISHYNNQYDAIAGFACQFFGSADLRWLAAMEDLARHVVDIDIYHTTGDKAAYSQGLFWHTAHHTDAGRATHRTYPRAAAPASGGPSPEHNYNTGLMLHYFLTGDPRSREAAIGLAEWVIAMDDGARTPLRWLSRRPTGLASATGSRHYHGPGRAPGNSIVALMNACRLTGDARYLSKAEELMRRCAHPEQDLEALNLLDAERRWYYTVFLQALGRYLEFKAERGEVDEQYAYARATLLHYARWMVVHEYPYLQKPEILEYPTETWAAQDMRKSDVFEYAARHAAATERERFLERARFFFDASVSSLSGMSTRTFTRPVVLMLTNGYLHATSGPTRPAPAPDAAREFGRQRRFVPQRTKAVRAAALMAAALVTLAAAAGLLL